MSGLKIKKENANQLLKEKVIRGEAIAQQIGKITDVNQYSYMVDVHAIWWQATGNLLKQIFDDDAVAKEFQYFPPFAIDDPPLPHKIQRFRHSTQTDISRLQSIIDHINQDLYQPAVSSRSLYDKIVDRLKNNKVAAILLLTFVILTGLLEISQKIIDLKKESKDPAALTPQPINITVETKPARPDTLLRTQPPPPPPHRAHFIVSIDGDYDLASEITLGLRDISFIGNNDDTVRITYYPNLQPKGSLYSYPEDGHVVAIRKSQKLFTFTRELIQSSGPNYDDLNSIVDSLNQQVAAITRKHIREITDSLREKLRMQ